MKWTFQYINCIHCNKTKNELINIDSCIYNHNY